MKTKNYYLLLLGLAITVFSCKKNEVPAPALPNNPEAQFSGAPTGLPRLSVITIAGGTFYNDFGYVDGPGAQARFHDPMGIDLMDDGTIYVADRTNNKIRKISPLKVVSTIPIPNSGTQTLEQPRKVRVLADGTINTIEQEHDGDATTKKVWILRPGGQLITPAYHDVNYHYFDLVRNPYTNYMFMCGVAPVYINGTTNYNYKASLEKFILNSAATIIGKDAYTPPVDSLNAYDKTNPFFTAIYCGYNNVKYLCINRSLYKLTSSGVFTEIYRGLIPTIINDIIVTKDSRTIYLCVDNGIYSLYNNTVTRLVGMHEELHGKDGIGRDADVHPLFFALSKDESTIYFSDYGNNSIRKLILR
jgi:hypothetical protein